MYTTTITTLEKLLCLVLLMFHYVESFSTKCLLKDDFEECMKEKNAQDGMKRYFLNDRSVTCNDGSPAG